MLNSDLGRTQYWKLKEDTVSTGINRIDERLAQLLAISEVEDDDETIPPEEVEESVAAWQDYKAGRDPGVSLEELKLKLFGKKLS